MPVNPSFNFDDNFELATIKEGDVFPFYAWAETDAKIKWWASGNAGFRVTGLKVQPLEYPTCPELKTGIDGNNCIKLATLSTGSLGSMVNMPIAAGNLFAGTFDTESAMKEPLSATRMGLPYAHKPIRMTGFYKYVRGAVMQDRSGDPLVGEFDYPDFYCVVYRNTDEQGNPVQLDGNILSEDIKSNPHKDKIVGMGRIKSEDIVINGNKWESFSIPIVYTKDISEEEVFDYKFNTAIVFSSSIRGAEFIGAPGSTLWIDNVKLECEY